MRRSLRIFLVIGVLFTLAVLALWNQDVDLPGDSFDRGGTGPLGLTLGLDLRGGAHLVYQADSPVNINATFEQPVSESELKEGLDQLDLGSVVISPFQREEFSLDVPGIDEEGVPGFMEELQVEVGPATNYDSS